MRVPELYNQKSWQFLLVGVFIGSLISWLLFLYFFGQLQDKQLLKIQELQGEVESLKKDKEVLYEDIKNANKKSLELLTLQEINVEIINAEKYHLTTFGEYKLKQNIRNEISSLLTNNINGITENMEIIIKSIENKQYLIENNVLKVKVSRFALTTTLTIKISIINFEQK
ncbi:hypothetical protein FS935_22030 [Metabacillus litoralis]|uniref:Sporulation membrane protein YtrI C-terminal domain-containing protein n=1 Tax=Metabacillus litoralis TaxID=152268 RepID=A0A5C6V8B4_9BACI|nr:sporulation membrane protein YtrI [Metabacillus litoralis]TXC81583.1 hypothetical protein FS935_22030 [Metabacillus litoralis]